jgi:hypothetical protein
MISLMAKRFCFLAFGGRPIELSWVVEERPTEQPRFIWLEF